MQRSIYLVGLTALSAIGGCGKSGSGPEVAAVSGTVYLDGTPAADLDVNFMNGTYTVFGRTDAQGKYELPVGAAVGDNKVYFSKITGAPSELNAAEGMDSGQLMAMRDPGVHPSRQPKQAIPEKFSDPTKTTISFVVPAEGSDEANFELQTR